MTQDTISSLQRLWMADEIGMSEYEQRASVVVAREWDRGRQITPRGRSTPSTAVGARIAALGLGLAIVISELFAGDPSPAVLICGCGILGLAVT